MSVAFYFFAYYSFIKIFFLILLIGILFFKCEGIRVYVFLAVSLGTFPALFQAYICISLQVSLFDVTDYFDTSIFCHLYVCFSSVGIGVAGATYFSRLGLRLSFSFFLNKIDSLISFQLFRQNMENNNKHFIF